MAWTDLQSDRLSWLQLGNVPKKELALAIDPYLLWADLTDFAGYSGIGSFAQKVPLAIEVKQAGDIVRLVDTGWIEAPSVYLSSGGRFLTAYAQAKNLAAIAALDYVERMELGLPLPFLLNGAQVLNEPVSSPPPKGGPDCVVGVVDIGCAFLNRAFCKPNAPDSTRLRCVWQQSGSPVQEWTSPEGFGYGRELKRVQIDTILKRTMGDPARERAEYERLDYLHDAGGRLITDSHGTFVLDTAAGLVESDARPASSKPREPGDCASTADLIFVDVPQVTLADTSAASLCVHIIDALHYIVARSDGAPHIVVNLSIGAQAGPHDGTSIIEEAIDGLVRQLRATGRTLAVVMAAGNGAELKCHAAGTITPANEAVFLWRLLPDDNTDSFLEIWYDVVGAGHVDVQVESPDGEKSDWVPLGAGRVFATGASAGKVMARGPVTCAVLHCPRPATGKNGPMIAVMMAPSKGSARRTYLTEHGLWRIALRLTQDAGADASADFQAWVERDDPPVGDPGVKRQSVLVDTGPGAYVQTKFGCLNNIATGLEPIVVAAYDLASGRITRYSSRGPKTGTRNRNADVMAPADESPGQPGLVASGVLSGQRFRMSGTSVAAPFVARQAVALLCCGKNPNGGSVWTHDDLIDGLIPQTKRSAPGAAVQQGGPVATPARTTPQVRAVDQD